MDFSRADASSEVPPQYTPSTPSPKYSSTPLPGEEQVATSQRVPTPTRTGSFRRITDKVTVVLRDQLPGSVQPIYGRHGFICGYLVLHDITDLVEVSIKLVGIKSLGITAFGTAVKSIFLEESYTMWTASSAEPCPDTIPFALVWPPTFSDAGQTRPIPPSYKCEGLSSSLSYEFTVTLSKRKQLLGFLKPMDSVSIPLTYLPRIRPPAPMIPSELPFMSTVKSSPEEWHQIMCSMQSVYSSDLAAIQCCLFIPAVQIFALSDAIPFHIQFHGPEASLRYLRGSDGLLEGGEIQICVSLKRRTMTKVLDSKAQHTRVIGEGRIATVKSRSQSRLDGSHALDCDGELTIDHSSEVPIRAPSFSISDVAVRDLIVLELKPLQPLKSPFIEMIQEHPIRLVTDPWTEEPHPA
ncbi:hypothetical protein CONPUDRAFT_147670 [Coniophora puteana RWD-64-598 SS2]|uniref:Arrestin-like N-terminal domain-containing protein n=1 Tax=Coniophora puteana (strain RWD-64-598) TaxID=741705 RepID=R7SFR7_CONPW|nr:uncharacterized protein CONPUDRAFT_147670 [Coniophora puteana RWD-64-598 SS2]EIW74690.1 hypothetical protein CONPUDRAFT_147670 [Coniophora puteana RWD-64-598 SS2]